MERRPRAMSEVQEFRRNVMQTIARGVEADVLVCYTHSSAGGMDTVWYATGVRPMGAAVAILSDSKPVLFVSPPYDEARAKTIASDCEVHGVDNVLVAAAERLGHSADQKIALCGNSAFTASTLREFKASLGREWHDVSSAILTGTAGSDEAKINAARKAAWVAEEGYRQTIASVRPGIREYEMVARLDHAMRELGAEDNFLLMSASQHPTSVNTPGDRILAEGDRVLAEISPCVDGVFMQICRTIILGVPSPKVIESYQLLQESFAAGVAACEPGRTLGEVVQAVNEPIEAAGFGEFCRPPYMRARGHGMGYGSIRPSNFNIDSTEELVEGMVFVLHPNQYLPDVGYLMCGDPVVVRADGAEVLCNSVAQLDVVEV
jgi:Xaa-Pro dipeptidase